MTTKAKIAHCPGNGGPGRLRPMGGISYWKHRSKASAQLVQALDVWQVVYWILATG